MAGAVFTGGASLGLLAIVGGVAGATAGGAKISEVFIQKHNLNNLSSLWHMICLHIRDQEESQGKKIESDDSNFLFSISQVGVGCLAAVFRNVVLNTANAGLSLYDLIDASEELSKKTKSKPGELLREMAQCLDKFLQSGIWPE